jgi:hypothetical protein
MSGEGMAMDLSLTRNFNHNEKVATLKLMIKIASSDGEISESEKGSLIEYSNHSKLKATENFIQNAMKVDIGQIISAFESKANLKRVQSLAHSYAEEHGIDPDFEGVLLETLNESVKAEKKKIKFSLNQMIKEIFLEFGYLWGKDNVSPKTRQILAIIFTSLACYFSAQWTEYWVDYKMLQLFETTNWVYPSFTNMICGLLIFSALCVRGYLPVPNNIRNILFAAVNIGLLSYISMHILGRGLIERTITEFVFFGLILVLWLGIKEVVGFAFIGFFILFIYKLHAIDIRISWRAFPYIFSAFIGIGFQSANFFDDFGNFANSMFKKAHVDKEFVKEGIEIVGQQTKRATKATVKAAVTATKLSTGAV